VEDGKGAGKSGCIRGGREGSRKIRVHLRRMGKEQEMKAWVLHSVGDIRLETVEEPQAGKGEVLAAVRAAGVCGSDIPRIYRTGAHVHPLIPGHEFSGVVVRTGEGVDRSWQGKRVGIFPLIPCGDCGPCRKGQIEMCRNYSYLGSRRDGGFAEYVAVPAQNLVELPEGVSFEEAAMLEPMAVAVHAMRRAVPGPGDTAAVCGLGTIGLLLLMFLLEERGRYHGGGAHGNVNQAGAAHGNGNQGSAAYGAGNQHGGRILAVGNKEFQKRKAVELGLPEECFCDSRVQDPGKWLMERTGGAGADVFFECVGKCETFSQAVDCAAPGGRVCLVGNPASDMRLGQEVYWKILRNQLTLTGTWNSSIGSIFPTGEKGSFTCGETDDWQYVLERLEEKKIAPARLISHRFPMEEMELGFELMRDKKEEYGKVMGVFS